MQKKQLYHHCFECADVQEGDIVPVGGGIIGSAHMPWKVKADFETFYPKFAGIAERTARQFESPAWQDWFKGTLPDIDPDLATALQTFTTAFEAKRKLQNLNSYERQELYDQTEGQCVALSEVFNTNHAMCLEMALLAKRFLDEKGIKSRLFSGEAMFDYTPGDINIPAAHSFLIIEHQGQEYIFDPANPTKAQDGRMLFSLLKPKETFASRVSDLEKNCLMIAAENVFTHHCTYYGVGDFTNIPEGLIVHGSNSEQFKGKDQSAASRA